MKSAIPPILSPGDDAADVPTGTTAGSAILRKVSQPKRGLYRYVTAAFHRGILKPGARVMYGGKPHVPTVPSASAIMRGKI